MTKKEPQKCIHLNLALKTQLIFYLELWEPKA